MTDKILFGVIGVLLFSIAGIGASAAAKHPAETVAIVPEGIAVVEKALSNSAAGIEEITEAALGTAEKPAAAASSGVSPKRETDSRSFAWRDEDDEEDEEDGRSASVNTPIAQPTSPAPPATNTFTMADVSAHASASSCYTVIGGSVYDLTSFIRQHPGGSAAIMSLCGVDGTSAFMAQHGGQGRPEQELASLKIGVLAK